jgi:hypothetical protein
VNGRRRWRRKQRPLKVSSLDWIVRQHIKEFITEQSKSAGDKAIARILDLRSERDEIHGRIRKLRSMHHATKDEEEETRQALNEDLSAAQDALNKTVHRLTMAEKSLGMPSRRRLEKLVGDTFINARMNARALKTRIRAKLISRKFERSLLERAYRHHTNRMLTGLPIIAID